MISTKQRESDLVLNYQSGVAPFIQRKSSWQIKVIFLKNFNK